MKQSWIIILAALWIGCSPTSNKTDQASSESGEPVENWISLFNGNDLTDWTVKITGYELGNNYGNTFRVEDGMIKVAYDSGYEEFNNRFGHMFYKDPFSSYRLRVEYRFVGDQVNGGEGWALRNSGIMYHCLEPSTMTVEQAFPVCQEAQFLGGDGQNPRSTMNLCTPSSHVYLADTLNTNHCINSTSETFHGEQWVTAELEVYRDSLVRHYVNGVQVMEYTRLILDDGTPMKGGYIALQSESHPIHFRKVELLNLE